VSLSHSCPKKWALNVIKIAKIGEKEGKRLARSIVRNDEVVGSIPTSSTKSFNH